jgi:hypothetical protein
MRDASGKMYMRNRYYDPVTGQFTQTDPIGIAGGLNVYGFAAGDPVGFWDPFGLCAWGFGRDAALGNCTDTDRKHAPQTHATGTPLTGTDAEFVRQGAEENLRGVARRRILRHLNTGKIWKVGGTAHRQPAEAAYLRGGINVTAAFFTSQTRSEAAWMLAHEDGHLIQYAHGMLMSELAMQNTRPSRRRILSMFNPTNSIGFDIVQRDANRYACSYTIDPGKWKEYCEP